MIVVATRDGMQMRRPRKGGSWSNQANGYAKLRYYVLGYPGYAYAVFSVRFARRTR